MAGPNTPTILLLGSRGQVGWELRRTLTPLGPIVAPSRTEVDLADEAALQALVARVQPGIVVNAGAYTAVDQAEEEPELAHTVNGRAPAVLAGAARAAEALFVHYSTDYVFDGTKDAPYTEEDRPRPLNVYGQSKLEGEEGIRAAGGAHLIFRTSWVYSLRRHNFLLTMLRLAHQQVPLRVVATQIGAPTPAWLIAQVTSQVLGRWQQMSDGEQPTGLFHLAAAGQTSWHGFAKAIFRHVYGNAAPTVVPITPDEYPTPAARPAYSVLSCEKLMRSFGVHVPAWEEVLQPVCDAVRERRTTPAFLLEERRQAAENG